MAADRIDFVDKDNARCVLLALLKEVPDAAGPHAHKHLNEIRAGDREKRHTGFAGDGAGEQGLAGSRRTNQQDAFGNPAAQLLELLWLPQKLDDFLPLDRKSTRLN